jgi:ABC-type multidrug transport system fused ATPase/permease subunit
MVQDGAVLTAVSYSILAKLVALVGIGLIHRCCTAALLNRYRIPCINERVLTFLVFVEVLICGGPVLFLVFDGDGWLLAGTSVVDAIFSLIFLLERVQNLVCHSVPCFRMFCLLRLISAVPIMLALSAISTSIPTSDGLTDVHMVGLLVSFTARTTLTLAVGLLGGLSFVLRPQQLPPEQLYGEQIYHPVLSNSTHDGDEHVRSAASVQQFRFTDNERTYSYTFSWIDEVFDIAAARTLRENDVPELSPDCDCAYNSNLLRSAWSAYESNDEPARKGTSLVYNWKWRRQLRASKLLRRGSLVPALIKVYATEYLSLGGYVLVYISSAFAGPMLISKLVQSREYDAPAMVTAFYVAALVLSRIVYSASYNYFNFLITQIKIAATAAIKGCIYSKILAMSTDSRREYTAGNISTIYTVDVDRIVTALANFHSWYMFPLQIVFGLVLLYCEVSYAMFAGLATILAVMLLNNFIFAHQKRENDEIMRCKDERLKFINEYLSSVLIVKLNVWEKKFHEFIDEKRKEELYHVWRFLNINAALIFIFWLVPCLVSVITITVYVVVLKKDITASKIFTTLALFRMLQEPLRAFPGLMSQCFQALTSMERMRKFYIMKEMRLVQRLSQPGTGNSHMIDIPMGLAFQWNEPRDRKTSESDVADNADAGIELSSLTTPLNVERDICTESKAFVDAIVRTGEATSKNDFTLSITSNIKITAGELVVVSGPVGSGKSSLLAAILGEMYPCVASAAPLQISMYGSVALVSQQPWIQNLSIRDNILFGKEYEPSRYQDVLRVCCLFPDLKELPERDRTLIGERGVNLSGGQRARISLARAVYADVDILLMDDILSALDPAVATYVFAECIVKYLATRTRVLATHNPDVISSSQVNRILRLVGGVCDQETYGKTVSNTDDVASERAQGNPTQHNDAFSTILALTDPHEVSKVTKRSGGISSVEERAEGRVDRQVYVRYLTAMGGMRFVGFLCVVQTTWQVLSISSDLYLSHWTKESSSLQHHRLVQNLVTYSILSIGSGCVVLARSLTVSWSGYAAAKWIFEEVMGSLMKAPMAWYDKNPTGRILNRLSDDQSKIDSNLPFAVGSIFAMVFSMIGDLVTVTIATKYLVVGLIPAGWCYVRVMQRFLAASREIQRMQSIAQSPVLSLMSETTVGVSVVRASGQEIVDIFMRRHESLINVHSQMQYAAIATKSWFIFRIQLLGAFVLMVIACLASFPIAGSSMTAGMIGLCLTYGLSITNSMQSMIEHISNLEVAMVCPERLLQYCAIPAEGTSQQKLLYNADYAATTDASATIPASLPVSVPTCSGCSSGVAVDFKNVSFRYQPDGQDILADLTFTVTSGEKVGIVGRTGSGKVSQQHRHTVYRV